MPTIRTVPSAPVPIIIPTANPAPVPGFTDITVENLQMQVAPSVAQVPWVTMRFLLTAVMFGKRRMTRARRNNVLAPVLLPLASAPLGPITYCMITAKKKLDGAV